jgi:16S rRNA (cytosine967-C5)-methyltransferase
VSKDPDARTLALKALDAVERRGAFAERVLDGLLARRPGLLPRERALASHLLYGVLRWRNRLDAHLARAASRPLEKVHPRLLQVLRLGAYQILFLDRIPDRAAVSESVELARRAGLNHACGFVNAVLRKVAAAGPDLPCPADPASRLSLLFGCPLWLVELWIREHGAQGVEFLCRAASQIPPLWLRVNPRRISRTDALSELQREGFTAAVGAYGPEAVRVESAGDPKAIPLVARGCAVVQDQASQLVAHLVAPEPSWRILDACAAPGLKATHLAVLAGEESRVTALELRPHRARAIGELAGRLRCGEIQVEVADAREFRPAEAFHAVLVDAPCSGLGVLNRNPEAKWRRRPDELLAYPRLQLALLENLAAAVRPGGVLVYATCTTVRAENEGVIEAFLTNRSDFELEPPPSGAVSWDHLVTRDGHFRTFPEQSSTGGARALDGFFGARLRRGGGGG